MKIAKLKIKNYSRGYTIIETMVAVSLFLVVIMIGMGALLNANLIHLKSQDMRSIMDNLSFIMEDISKNLRTGYNYHCSDSTVDIGTPQSCASSGGIVLAFIKQEDSVDQQWAYKIEFDEEDVAYDISRQIDGSAWVQLNPDEVKLDSSSVFIVTGAEPPSEANLEQPFAIIKLSGNITIPGKNVVTPFSLQTSVSQRLLDR